MAAVVTDAVPERPASAGRTTIAGSTRVVLTLDLAFSLLAGGVLYVLATRTEDYFAWTIRVPFTAAVLGSGYLAAVAMLVPSYFVTEWRRVRIIPVIGFTLTSVTLVVTLWHVDEFHLGSGSASAQVAGWAWLVVYAVIPILLAVAFVRQERAGGRDEYVVEEPLLPLTRAVIAAQVAVCTVFGLGLVLAPSTFDPLWPWSLPTLSARAVGAWLLTLAAAGAWGLRERDWGRFRIAIPGQAALVLLIAVAVARYPDPLSGRDWSERLFLVGVVVLGVTSTWAALRQERQRARESHDPGAAAVLSGTTAGSGE